MVPACWLCGWRAHQRNNGLCPHFHLRGICPSSSCPDVKQFTSSYIYLVPFKLLPYARVQRVWAWISSCMGPLRGTSGSLKASVSLSHNPWWFLPPEIMRTYLPGTGPLGWGDWCGAGILPPQGRPQQARNASQFLTAGPAHFTSLSLLPVSMYLL